MAKERMFDFFVLHAEKIHRTKCKKNRAKSD